MEEVALLKIDLGRVDASCIEAPVRSARQLSAWRGPETSPVCGLTDYPCGSWTGCYLATPSMPEGGLSICMRRPALRAR